MTDEQVLAAALHRWHEDNGGCAHFDKGYGPYAQCEDPDEVVPHRFLAAMPDHAIVSKQDAELAEAVRRLPKGWYVTNWGYRWEVRQPQATALSPHLDIIRAEGARRERERLEAEGWHAPRPDCGPVKAKPHEHRYTWSATSAGPHSVPLGTPCDDCREPYEPADVEATT